MPPRASRKRTAADAASSSTATTTTASPAKAPLDGCRVALTGSFRGVKQAQIIDHIEALGGTYHRGDLSSDVTHLIISNAEYDKKLQRVTAAEKADIHIVSIYWIQDCATQNIKVSEATYLFPAAGTSQSHSTHWTGALAVAPNAQPQAQIQAQAPVIIPILDSDEDDDKPPTKKAKADYATGTKKPTRVKKAKADTDSQSQVADPPADTDKATDEPKSKGKENEKVESVVNGVVKSKNVHIPIDEECTLSAGYEVYIDDSGLVWDASLNQTNAGANNNKFYRLQLLRNKNDYKTWSRWGRVGVRGQSAILGTGSLGDAIAQFQKKFKDKSGLTWENRLDKARPKKYTFVERSYDPDSDDDDTAAGGSGATKQDGGDEQPAPCTLDPAVESLMTLIFNKAYFAATMSSLNYDANKLPLGKLSKNTILRGFETLKDLAALLDDNSLALSEYGKTLVEAVADLSNAYYSVIPHAFGFSRPPVIQEYNLLKKEMELLESLGDMKDAELIMKVASNKRSTGIHPLDESYKKLGMKEMTPLVHSGKEFKELSDYLYQTRGSTHQIDYKVEEIFRIERNGEFERFDKSIFGPLKADRRLLWHGSRVTNFGGILGQGLRIAPPEAPVSGYMFGKGVYLADMSSKSAGYCWSGSSGGTALLLLCEAELGDPMQKLVDASYNAGEDAKKAGMHSTWGQGSTGPLKWKDAGCVNPKLKGTKMPDVRTAPGPTNVPGAGLYYNEYIAYDVSQIRLRYLFRVKV